MKIATAIVMGFFAGLLPYLVARPSPVAVLMLLSFWSISAYLLQRRATNTRQILSRGFLLGAAEWMILVVAALGYSVFIAHSVGLFMRAFIMVAMAGFCLICFALVKASTPHP